MGWLERLGLVTETRTVTDLTSPDTTIVIPARTDGPVTADRALTIPTV
jgi:hypothetical protein